MEAYNPDVLWIVILGFIISFILAFGMGANDMANSVGTCVGAGVLTLKQACILATICEMFGALFFGHMVSDTMRKGILDVTIYRGDEIELMFGHLSALSSSAIWLLIATFFKLPVSATHSTVGSIVGFSLMSRGTEGLNFSTLALVVSSWIFSPLLSGFVSTILFLLIQAFLFKTNNTYTNDDKDNIPKLLTLCLILTGGLCSIAHGGNDVSNAIGPLIGIVVIYKEGSALQQTESPYHLLFFGAAGMCLGFCIWGLKLIETIGKDLTKITPRMALSIDFGSAITVQLATILGIPISTTHCKVGSVVCVGHFKSKVSNNAPADNVTPTANMSQKKGVNWKLVRNIIYAWILTVPVNIILSGSIMLCLTYIFSL